MDKKIIVKRIVALVIAVCMLSVVMPVDIISSGTAHAEENSVIASGKCGNALTWELAKNGTLTISGTGKMYDYTYSSVDNAPPWKDLRDKIYHLVIAEGVETIGKDAFASCGNLDGEIFFPDSVKKIGDDAFSYCDSIYSIRLSNNVDFMYLSEKFGGTRLRHIVYNGTSDDYQKKVRNSIYAGDELDIRKIHYNTSKIEYVIEEKGFKETCTEYGELDKKECPLCGWCVAIGTSIKPTGHIWEEEYTIDKNATETEPGLQSIHCSVCDDVKENSEEVIPTPTGVIAVGTCGSNVNWTLTKDGLLTIGGSGRLDGASDIRRSRWKDYNVKSVVIEEGITVICEWAFYDCESIESVVFPKSLDCIGREAFKYCSSLKDVYIGETVKEIGSDAFASCYGTDIYYTYGKDSNMVQNPFYGCNIHLTIAPSLNYLPEQYGYPQDRFYSTFKNHIKSIVISEGVTYIGDLAFATSHIEDIVLPKSLDEIGYDVFKSCNELKSITFLNPNTKISTGRLGELGYDGYIIRGYNNSTAYKLASDNNLTFIPIMGVQEAPSQPMLSKKTHNTVTLVAYSGYEYSMDGENWQTSNVFVGLNPETNYLFYQRRAENDRYYASSSSTSLTVKTDEEPQFITGDFNNDETVTDADALYLLYHTIFGDSYPIEQPCDYNKDGSVTDADALYLLYHTIFGESYPLN